jgi:pimeloyl-ACP methyl ester carboxylesterase
MPVYALTGSRDKSAPVAQGRAAADAAPMGRFHALDNLGHFALIEDPQACADAIVQLDRDRRHAVNPASRDEANK